MNRSSLGEYIRETVAGAARALWMADPSHDMQVALKVESGYSIVAGQASRYMNAQGYWLAPREYSQFCKLRRRTADAAQWVWINRPNVGSRRLINWPAAVIGRACENFKQRDAEAAQEAPPRTYTLEDMRTAYRMGFLAVTGHAEGAAAYFNTDGFSEDREAALGRI